MVRDANDALGARQHEVFEPRREPEIREWPLLIQLGDAAHVAVQRQHIGKARKDRAQAAIRLRALAMNEVRIDFPDFLARAARMQP